MIKYQLKCGNCSHQFEGWFADSAGYDKQAAAKVIDCPGCASSDISKAIMAPNIARRRGEDDSSMTAAQSGAKVRAAMREIRREAIANSDNVGEAFPEEARKIHYGEVEERSIHGEATVSETKDLVEEGIEILPLPSESDA
ncbi:MAG: DUF1178 family protein [Alphaproteobacteria bacterium]|nr:MAG: DUF1178 family protein [Alphaproteobacteria bacterium]